MFHLFSIFHIILALFISLIDGGSPGQYPSLLLYNNESPIMVYTAGDGLSLIICNEKNCKTSEKINLRCDASVLSTAVVDSLLNFQDGGQPVLGPYYYLLVSLQDPDNNVEIVLISCYDRLCSEPNRKDVTVERGKSIGSALSLSLSQAGLPVYTFVNRTHVPAILSLGICQTDSCESILRPNTSSLTIGDKQLTVGTISLEMVESTDQNSTTGFVNPVISYNTYVGGNGKLMVAYCVDPQCTKMEKTELSGDAAEFSDMVVYSDAHYQDPYVYSLVYVNFNRNKLMVINCETVQCLKKERSEYTIAEVTTGSIAYPQIVVDPSSWPAIAYFKTMTCGSDMRCTCNPPDVVTCGAVAFSRCPDIGCKNQLNKEPLAIDVNPDWILAQMQLTLQTQYYDPLLAYSISTNDYSALAYADCIAPDCRINHVQTLDDRPSDVHMIHYYLDYTYLAVALLTLIIITGLIIFLGWRWGKSADNISRSVRNAYTNMMELDNGVWRQSRWYFAAAVAVAMCVLLPWFMIVGVASTEWIMVGPAIPPMFFSGFLTFLLHKHRSDFGTLKCWLWLFCIGFCSAQGAIATGLVQALTMSASVCKFEGFSRLRLLFPVGLCLSLFLNEFYIFMIVKWISLIHATKPEGRQQAVNAAYARWRGNVNQSQIHWIRSIIQ